MNISEFAKRHGLSVLVSAEPDREITGGYVGDLLSWVMGKARSGDAWITIMSNINIAAVAALTDVACIIVAEGVKLEDSVVKVAEDKGINLLASDKSAFELAVILGQEL